MKSHEKEKLNTVHHSAKIKQNKSRDYGNKEFNYTSSSY